MDITIPPQLASDILAFGAGCLTTRLLLGDRLTARRFWAAVAAAAFSPIVYAIITFYTTTWDANLRTGLGMLLVLSAMAKWKIER